MRPCEIIAGGWQKISPFHSLEDSWMSASSPRPAKASRPVRSVPRQIPLFDLQRQRERLAVAVRSRIDRVLQHGQYILGPEVEELESRLAAYAGARHAIGVSSGRDALAMALMAVGVGPGDAVFVPAFTFAATAGAVAAVGAEPVLVDVDADTCNMSAAALERAIVETRCRTTLRPRAVMPVDLYGLPADYAALNAVAKNHELSVIADAAQSFGASRNGRRVGTLAPISATSFYPTKPLGAYGDGGAVFTDDDGLAEAVRQIRSHGRQGSGDMALRIGMTGRLDTIQAAILLVKLDGFEAELQHRRRIAAAYSAALDDQVLVPRKFQAVESAWALYTIRISNRDAVRARLEEAGVGTGIFYRLPLHRHPAFAPRRGYLQSLTVAERLAEEVLSLPLHPDLTDGEVEAVIEAVLTAVR
jgi:UDP-2-acetamido-2-deoxy-ribo-hexuluronate aminotransferase